MRFSHPLAAMAFVATLAATGCWKVETHKPSRPLSAGTLMIQFTRKVEGPVDLVIDGVRIPVARQKKKTQKLVVSGLSAGSHRYFISSPRDAFGPDHGVVDMPSDSGVFLVHFTQHYDSVLYGKPEPVPAAQGLPGVTAHLEP